MDNFLKKCNSCKEIKPYSEFEKKITCIDGVIGQCKICRNKRRNARANETKKITLISKVCSLCISEKKIVEFYKCKHTADGFAGWCKSCALLKGKTFSKNWYARELKKNSLLFKLKIMLNSAKGRAKKYNLPFDLDLDYLRSLVRDDGKCPALGIDLDWTLREQGRENSPTLDKIFPKLGYVRNNVAIISRKANTIKSDANSDEIFSVANWLINEEKKNV